MINNFYKLNTILVLLPLAIVAIGGQQEEPLGRQHDLLEDDTPCPQTGWKEIMEWGIRENDPSGSLDAIQAELHARYTGHRFLVTCAAATESGTTANRVHFSSAGEAYCNTVKGRVWCQAIQLAA